MAAQTQAGIGTEHDDARLVNMLTQAVPGFNSNQFNRYLKILHHYMWSASVTIDRYTQTITNIPPDFKQMIATLQEHLNWAEMHVYEDGSVEEQAKIYPVGHAHLIEYAKQYLPDVPMFASSDLATALTTLAYGYLSYTGLIYPTGGIIIVLPPANTLYHYKASVLETRHNEWCGDQNLMEWFWQFTYSLDKYHRNNVHNVSGQVQERLKQMRLAIQELEGKGKEIVMMSNPYSWT